MPEKPPRAPALIGFKFHHSPCVALAFDGYLYLSEICLKRMCLGAGAKACIGARAFRTALMSVDRCVREHENIRDSRVLMLRQCVLASSGREPVEIMEDGVRIRAREHKWFVRSDAARSFANMSDVRDHALFRDLALGALSRARVIIRLEGSRCDPFTAAA